MLTRYLYLCAGVAVSVLVSSAEADVVSFTNRNAFNAATSAFGSALTETFQAFMVDTLLSSDPSSPTSFTGFSAYYQGSGGPTVAGTVQIVDVPPFTGSGAYAPGSTTYLNTFAASAGNPFDGMSSQTFIILAPGAVAFGFDYGQWGDGSNDSAYHVTTNVGVFTASSSGGGGFLGVQTTDPGEIIQSVTWLPKPGTQGYDAIGVDNVVTVIPESATSSLLSIGCIMMTRRRHITTASGVPTDKQDDH